MASKAEQNLAAELAKLDKARGDDKAWKKQAANVLKAGEKAKSSWS
jgi:hypothetical protein